MLWPYRLAGFRFKGMVNRVLDCCETSKRVAIVRAIKVSVKQR